VVDLDDLEAKARAATAAPWTTVERREDASVAVLAPTGERIVASTSMFMSIHERRVRDAAFIAAANPAVVLDLITQLRAEQERADEMADFLRCDESYDPTVVLAEHHDARTTGG